MGNITSRELIESYDKRIQDLENRVLELEQRIILGMRKDKNGHLVFEKHIDTKVNNLYIMPELQEYDSTNFS